ncbi:hypothetical protein H0H93_001753 [Arthromyces matolae]|nr:hypothetical protein H0H93_001753 [Arthromyces matolae]
MVHLVIVVNAAPLPSHVDWQGHREDRLSSADANGESDNDGYDMSRFLGTTTPTAGSTNIAPTESIPIINPSSTSVKSDTAQDRGKDISDKEARKLLGGVSNDMELSQCPWNQNEGWPDQVLRAVITSIYQWQINVERHTRRSRGAGPALPDVKTRCAQLNEKSRSQLNSEMDILWNWVVRHRASIAHSQVLSARAKLSRLDADPRSRSQISDVELAKLLIKSVDRTIDISKMPWRKVKGTFQWKDDDDVKKALPHIWKLKHKYKDYTAKPDMTPEEKQILDGPRDVLLNAMDTAWKWWIHKQKVKKGSEMRKQSRQALVGLTPAKKES